MEQVEFGDPTYSWLVPPSHAMEPPVLTGGRTLYFRDAPHGWSLCTKQCLHDAQNM